VEHLTFQKKKFDSQRKRPLLLNSNTCIMHIQQLHGRNLLADPVRARSAITWQAIQAISQALGSAPGVPMAIVALNLAAAWD
jgi:hypothetical protein